MQLFDSQNSVAKQCLYLRLLEPPTIAILILKADKKGVRVMLKLRKKCSKTGKFRRPPRVAAAESLDSIDAYYRRFCDKNVHDPIFECCCRVIQIEDDEQPTNKGGASCSNNNNGGGGGSGELLDNFSQLSVNETSSNSSGVGGCSKKRRRRRKQSGNHLTVDGGRSSRLDSGLGKHSPMTSTTKQKYFSTSDLTCSSSLGTAPIKTNFMKGKRPLIDLHVKNLHVNHQFVNLRNHIEAFSASIPDLSKKRLDEISDHDKKILSRMAMKRTKEIAAMQDAQLARDYWDKEKVARERFIAEQNESYFRTIKEKREQEVLLTRKRQEKLAQEERAQIERLKLELADKEAKTETLLKNIEFQKEMKIYERRQREFQKMDMALVNQQEHEMNDEIWRHILIERLQQRIYRADNLRQRILDVQKCRIQTDNQLEHTIHVANYDETKKVERFKLQQLREKIQQRDQKYKEFVKHRSHVIHESQRKAKISAAMRELIKRSISPENVMRLGANVSVRPISNLSHCDSHIRLG